LFRPSPVALPAAAPGALSMIRPYAAGILTARAT
jgi:hypothetical protein